MNTGLGVPGFNPSSASDGLILSRWQLPLAHFVLQNEGNSLDQHSPIELPAMMEIFAVLFNVAVTSHMWLLNTWHMAGMIKELNFKFYLIISNLNSYMWLMAAILGVRGLD